MQHSDIVMILRNTISIISIIVLINNDYTNVLCLLFRCIVAMILLCHHDYQESISILGLTIIAHVFLFRCIVGNLDQGESRASVLESFLTVHYFGAASLLGGAKRGQIDGHVVADFYNTVSSLEAWRHAAWRTRHDWLLEDTDKWHQSNFSQRPSR